MEISQLKYFQAMARIKHFTKAADACAVSQSALSRSIAKLEAELGVPLFVRHARHAELTQAGEHFLYHIDRVLRAAHQRAGHCVRRAAAAPVYKA